MQISVWSCDNCGKEFRTSNWEPLGIITGSQIDIPSGRSENTHDHIDLCTDCLRRFVYSLLPKNEAVGEQLYRQWSKLKRRAA